MRSEQVLDLLRESSALLEGHFELSSGLHSAQYFQCALVLQYPDRAARLAHALVEKLGQTFADGVDVVIGPALGAVVWAQEVGRAAGCRAIFAERTSREPGAGMQLRRGFRLEPGERVLVVEDVVTTGGSVSEVLDLVAASGAIPAAVGVIVDRSGGEPFAGRDLPVVSLARVQAVAWKPAECALCRTGSMAVKPGSRPGATGAMSSGATSTRS